MYPLALKPRAVHREFPGKSAAADPAALIEKVDGWLAHAAARHARWKELDAEAEQLIERAEAAGNQSDAKVAAAEFEAVIAHGNDIWAELEQMIAEADGQMDEVRDALQAEWDGLQAIFDEKLAAFEDLRSDVSLYGDEYNIEHMREDWETALSELSEPG